MLEANTSPNVVIPVISEMDAENQMLFNLVSFPFWDQLLVAIVNLENEVSSMFIKAS